MAAEEYATQYEPNSMQTELVIVLAYGVCLGTLLMSLAASIGRIETNLERHATFVAFAKRPQA